MKLGIVLSVFNRPEYLTKCLESISLADIPTGTLFVIVDDASTDVETIDLIRDFSHKNADVIIHTNEKNSSISYSLKLGYNKCFSYGCDVVMNLDSDAIVKKDFIQVLTDLHNYKPQHIVSGFHSINKNKNGTDRHPIIQKSEKWASKKSIGGINMMMNEKLFRSYMEPALDKVLSSKAYNWDFLCCCNCLDAGFPVVVSIPSVVQHIGFDSAMRHTEEPDVACDFVMPVTKAVHLPNVTLIAVEGVDLNKIKIPFEASTKFIEYGAVKLLTPFSSSEFPVVNVPEMKNKGAYSEFILKKLNDYVDTDFVLTIQHDGYVVNPKAWTDDFLLYDYIGATWNWYGDQNIVGNGGFSLRSKKLLRICATDRVISETHPEDHAIGRTYRNYLEIHHGIKFAPKEIADKFSLEAYKVSPPGNKYAGSFGFHGRSVDFRDADLVYNPSKIGNQHSNGGRPAERRALKRTRYTGR